MFGFSKSKYVPAALVLAGIFILQRQIGTWVPIFNWGTIIVGAFFLAFFLGWANEKSPTWIQGWMGLLITIILGTILGILMGTPQLNQQDVSAPRVMSYPFQVDKEGKPFLNVGLDGTPQISGLFLVEFGEDAMIAVLGRDLANTTLHAVAETDMTAYNAAIAAGTDALGKLSSAQFLSTFGSKCGRHSALKWGQFNLGNMAKYLPDAREDASLRWYRWACSGSMRVGRYVLVLEMPTGSQFVYPPGQTMAESMGTLVINPSDQMQVTGSGPVTTTISLPLPTIDSNVPAAGTFR